jgi:hypothetical protein
LLRLHTLPISPITHQRWGHGSSLNVCYLEGSEHSRLLLEYQLSIFPFKW